MPGAPWQLKGGGQRWCDWELESTFLRTRARVRLRSRSRWLQGKHACAPSLNRVWRKRKKRHFWRGQLQARLVWLRDVTVDIEVTGGLRQLHLHVTKRTT